MSSVINNQPVTIQKLGPPVCVGATGGSPSLPATVGSLSVDPTTPGALYVGNGTNWINAASSFTVSTSTSASGAPVYAQGPSTSTHAIFNSITGDGSLTNIQLAPPSTGGNIIIGAGPNAVTTTNTVTMGNKTFDNTTKFTGLSTQTDPSIYLPIAVNFSTGAIGKLTNVLTTTNTATMSNKTIDNPTFINTVIDTTANPIGLDSNEKIVKMPNVALTNTVQILQDKIFDTSQPNPCTFFSTPPANATATGTAGTITWDSGFIYVCIATNTWKRVAIATW